MHQVIMQSQEVRMQNHPMSHEANFMRSWVCPLILGLLAASPAFADEPSIIVLEGDVSALYVSGDFTVFDPQLERSQAKTVTAFTLSTPGDAPPSGEFPPGAIGQATIGPDGKFRLEIAVDKPPTAYFSIFNAMTSDEFLMGPVSMGNNFILEPGELKFRLLPGNYFDIEGGYYNDVVYNSWRLSDKYQATQLEFVRLITHEEDESEQAKRRRLDRLGEAQDRKIPRGSRARM